MQTKKEPIAAKLSRKSTVLRRSRNADKEATDAKFSNSPSRTITFITHETIKREMTMRLDHVHQAGSFSEKGSGKCRPKSSMKIGQAVSTATRYPSATSRTTGPQLSTPAL